MAYIGNPVDTAFTSLLKQDLTGASGTSLTLSHAVANANDIALYINNVRQEPTEAYSVNGTTVTLTGTVAGTDDIYVIYLARAIQTTVPPDGSVSSAKIANNSVDLTSKVTGILPVANGGTGVNSATSAATTLTEVATTSGTSQDITVPSTAKVIYVGIMAFSHSGGNAHHEIQLGTASGIVTSGYLGTATFTGGGHTNSGDNVQMTDSFPFVYSSHHSTEVYGLMTIVSMGGNKWVYSSNVKTGSYVGLGGGYVSLGGAITTVRIQTDGGNTLDGGSFNVTYIE